MIASALALIVALSPVGGDCSGLRPPVPGAVVRPFAPVGSYGGHWGVDIVAPLGSPVRASAQGVVTFAASVGAMISVTVSHGGELRTSYSYLTSVAVEEGDNVDAGQLVGLSGTDHGLGAVHWSLRLKDRYFSPLLLVGCGLPGDALRLEPPREPEVGSAYPVGRAAWHLGRYFRSATLGASGGRRRRI